MKKLFVLAIAAIMILSMAAISMAATTTIGGEFESGFKFYNPDTNPAISSGNKSVEWGDMNLKTTTTLNDQVNVIVNMKGNLNGSIGFDEADVNLKESFGSIKAGYFAYNTKDTLDILGGIQGWIPVTNNSVDLTGTAAMGDIKNQAAALVTVPVAKGFTAQAMVAQPNDNVIGTKYSAGVAYATNAYGADFYYLQYAGSKASDIDPAMVLNAYYNMAPAKLFVNYGQTKMNGQDLKSSTIGALVDSANIPVYARFEYELQKNDNITFAGGKPTDNAYGVRVGYKMNGGAKLEYQRSHDCFKNDTDQVKVDVTF